MERAVDAGVPAALLAEQYRMHPAICAPISAAFYGSKLRTAAALAAQRPHPAPCRFAAVVSEEEFHKGAGYSNEAEAARWAAGQVLVCVSAALGTWLLGSEAWL